MHTRFATLADATDLAKSLNLQTELVWQIIQGLPYTSLADLEAAVHTAFLSHVKSHPPQQNVDTHHDSTL
jgi:hypothetical protein